MKIALIISLFLIFTWISCYHFKSKRSIIKRRQGKQELKRSLNLNQKVSTSSFGSVITGIEVLSSKNQNQACRYGFSVVNSGCPSQGCDLNAKAGGDYIYLCVQKTPFENTNTFINALDVLVNNENCQPLSKTGGDLNKGAGGASIYLCMGYDARLAPIDDIYINYRDHNSIPSGYEPINIDLNKGSKGYYIYLYFHRNNAIPKKITYSNLVLDMVHKNIVEYAPPSFIKTIENNNGNGDTESTISQTIMQTKSSSYTWNIKKEGGLAIEASFGWGFASTISVDASLKVEFKWGSTEGERTDISTTESTTFYCIAAARKYYKCAAFIQKYKVTIPYTCNKKYTFYDGTTKTETVTSVFDNIYAGQTNFSKCCYKFCDKFDNLCPGASISSSNNLNSCPYQGDISDFKEIPNENIKLKYDPLLITDIQVISGDKNIRCRNGYTVVGGNGDGCTGYGCDLNMGAKGDYIYVCVKKELLSTMTTSPVNVYKILVNENTCPGLITTDVNLNQGTKGYGIYLCYGKDKDSTLAPISDILIYIKTVNSQNNYDCDPTDLNMQAGGKYIYFCYKRETNAPRRIEIRNLKYSQENLIQLQVGKPTKVDEIIARSSTVSKESSETSEISKTMNKEFDFGVSVTVTTKVGDDKLGARASLAITGSYSYHKEEEWEESQSETQSTTLSCSAPEKKTIKCYSYVSTYEFDVPYTAELAYYRYDGIQYDIVSISGIFQGVTGSSIFSTNCCLEGCCTGDNIKDSGKSQCISGNPDVQCSELDKCFE